VVNTASVAGLVRNSTNASYGVSKHAVVALSESLHAELQTRETKVRVSVLCPGPVDTDILNSSERNRPDTVPPPPELTQEEALFRKAFGIWLERGLDPKDVGRQVLDAIREERFYVITHDYDAVIEDRMKAILEKENPGVREPPQDLLEIFQELVSQSSSSD
jgi:short-subunit dehydrogenase